MIKRSELVLSLKKFLKTIFSIRTLLIIAYPVALYFVFNFLKNGLDNVKNDLVLVKSSQENFNQNFSEELFQDHLQVLQNIKNEKELKDLEVSIEELKNSKNNTLFVDINNIYTLYKSFQSKFKRNSDSKLKVDEYMLNTDSWGELLLAQDFKTLESSMSDQSKKLDEEYKKYLASLPPPTPSGTGYSYKTITIDRGTFGVYLIKSTKSSVRVKTVAAIENDCKNNCPTKSLAQYAQENNAFAGMTGSYACPADYSQCAGKVWSFDFALYDSNDGKWFNKKALTWNETGLITFNGSSSKFYEDTSKYDGDGVTAAVSNFPALLENGNIEVDSGDIDSYQSVRGLRGAIGTDDSNIYLAYITNASVIDAGYVMKALGAKDALNLDGGGTAALYLNGSYIVGPGRPLANAILLLKQ